MNYRQGPRGNSVLYAVFLSSLVLPGLEAGPAASQSSTLPLSIRPLGLFVDADVVSDTDLNFYFHLFCPGGQTVTKLAYYPPEEMLPEGAPDEIAIYNGEPDQLDFRGSRRISVSTLLRDNVCSGSSGGQDVPALLSTVAVRCSGDTHEHLWDLHIMIGDLKCDYELPSEIHDPTTRTNPGPVLNEPPPSFGIDLFVPVGQQRVEGTEEEPGFGLHVSFLQRGRSTFELGLGRRTGTRRFLGADVPSELEFESYDVDLLWIYTLLGKEGKVRLRSVFGPGGRFTLSENGEGDRSFALVGGLRLEFDLRRNLRVSLEARRREVTNGVDEGSHDELRLGLGFRFGR